MNLKPAAAALCVIALGGCGLKPALVKHYGSVSESAPHESLTIAGQDGTLPNASSLIDGSYLVSAFVIATPPRQPGAFVTTLGDRAQSTLIAQLGARETSSDELISAVARPNVRPAPSCAAVGPIRFERRLILSLSGRHSRPATRFDAMSYKLELNAADASNPARFTSWNRFESMHDTVSLGTTRLKQVQSASLTDVGSDTVVRAATATTPAKTMVDTLTAIASTSRELEESIISTRRFTSLTGALADREAAIVQQGAVGIDLFGNISADFTIEVPSASIDTILSIRGLFEKGIAQADDKKLALNWCPIARPTRHESVLATLTAAGVLRVVADGDDTVIEGDDHVAYRSIKAEPGNEITLVSSGDLGWDTFYIARVSGAADPLPLQSSHPYVGVLKFAQLEDAKQLILWLRATRKTSIAGLPLTLPASIPDSETPWMKPYSADDAASLAVIRTRHENGKGRSGVVWK